MLTEIFSLFQAIFKDKKLERLWQKAHKVGLEEEELILLKKEFQHNFKVELSRVERLTVSTFLTDCRLEDTKVSRNFLIEL